MFDWSCDSPPAELFPPTIEQPEGGFRTLIVGGGLAGLLTALRLSRDPERVAQGLVVLESSPSLGGRLFFSDPVSGLSTAVRAAGPHADFRARFERTRAGHGSGFGFEILSGDVAEVIERHLRGALSDEESAFLDAAASLPEGMPSVGSGAWVIKKELTPWRALLGGPTEILTRKEASELATLLQEGTPEALKSALSREGIQALVETLVRREASKLPPGDILEMLRAFAMREAASVYPGALARRAGIELALELVLRARGVKVRTHCRVMRVQANGDRDFAVGISDAFCREVRELRARNVVLALPLMSSFALMPRDHFSGAQSRGILKCPPSSLVALEYRDFEGHLQPELAGKLAPGQNLLFPVERAQGFVSTTGHLVLFVYLDYEQSLEAPKVREAVARMRRAAQRVLASESLQGLAGQNLVKNENLARERVVLLPVARYLETPSVTLRETRMGAKGLFCCGDNFTYEPAPWKNVVQSVQDVVHHLAKG